MKNRHVPIRTCIGCGLKEDKKKLYKVIKKGDEYIFDERQKIDGRSIYLCKNTGCINKAGKSKRIKLKKELLEIIKNSVEKELNKTV